MTIPFVKQDKLYQKIASIIIQLIKDRVFSPGDFLPPERILAKQLGVSRTSLRDGLIVLEISNWVRIEPGNGVIVCGDNLMACHGDYTIDDILDSRIIIDSACAKQAATFADAAAKQALIVLVNRMDTAIEQHKVHEFYLLDKNFHLAIAAACQNQVLQDINKILWAGRINIPYAGLEQRAGDQHVLCTLNQQHRLIATAIACGDAELAANNAILHIQEVRNILRAEIPQSCSTG